MESPLTPQVSTPVNAPPAKEHDFASFARPLRHARPGAASRLLDTATDASRILTREIAFQRYKDLGQSPEDILLPVSFRANTLKIDPESLITRLKSVGILAKKLPFLKFGYEIEKSKFSIGASLEYLLGLLYTQEAASQLAVEVLDPKPGELVADLCSAPGGKTTQIAQWMNNQGTIIALEKTDRVFSVRNNLERCDVRNTALLKKDARFITDLGMEFDKILVDAPCSGNFAGDSRWFGKRSLDGVHNRSVLQKELLKGALECLKPGGVLVYSTCSLEPEEDEQVIDFILRKCPGVRLLPIDSVGDPGLTTAFGKKLDPSLALCRRLWPWKSKTQGFFMAKMTYEDPLSKPKSHSSKSKKSKPDSQIQASEVQE